MSCPTTAPHILLKGIILILLVAGLWVTMEPRDVYDHSKLVETYTISSIIVILVLIITDVGFSSPKITEICLMVVTIIMLMIASSGWARRGHIVFGHEKPGAWFITFYKSVGPRWTHMGVTLASIILGIIDISLHIFNK